MKIAKEIRVEIAIKAKRRDHCSETCLFNNPDAYYCHLFGLKLKETRLVSPFRCQPCFDAFGEGE